MPSIRSRQDLRIADLIEREARARHRHEQMGLMKPPAIKQLREETDHWLPQVRAYRGRLARSTGLDRLMAAVVERTGSGQARADQRAARLAEVVAAHPRPRCRRRIRLDYLTQPKSRPPSFVRSWSRRRRPDAIGAYELRETTELPSTPIRLTLREGQPHAKRKNERCDCMTARTFRACAQPAFHLHHRAARHAGARHWVPVLRSSWSIFSAACARRRRLEAVRQRLGADDSCARRCSFGF